MMRSHRSRLLSTASSSSTTLRSQIIGVNALTPTSVPFCSAQPNRSPLSTAW
jgi:hypothetical protein